MAEDCEQITGRGCPLLVSPPDGDCSEGSRGDDDTQSDSGGALGGDGWFDPRSECSASPGLVSLWPLLLVLLAVVRRAGPALAALLLLLPTPSRADGINADGLAPADGGEALSMQEADLGGTWSPAGAATWSLALSPVVSRAGEEAETFLLGVSTAHVGLSLRVANGPRVGFAIRQMEWSYRGNAESGAGDTTLWVAAPLVESTEFGVKVSVLGSAVIASGPTAVFLSDEAGAVDGGLSAGWFSGLVTLHGQAVFRLQQMQTVQNLRWGPHLRWAAAASARPFGVGLASVELFGSVPLHGAADFEAQTPVELVASAGGCVRWGACLRGGAGGGLNWGLGAPAVRVVAALEYRPPPMRDTDDDGLPDLRDRCPREPEDTDLVQDGDGCPETDADQDGIADGADVCPLVPETLNGWGDNDGCPDSVTTVELLVRGVPDGPTETALVEGLSSEATTVFFGEVARLRGPSGEHSYTVEAEGYRAREGRVTAMGASVSLVVDLEPVRYAEVRLRALSPTGEALPAWVRRGAAVGVVPDAVPLEGATWRVEAAPAAWRVYASGFASREVQVLPVAGETLELAVELSPTDVRVAGDRLLTERSIRFELDRATLQPEALPVLDDIVALLSGRPDIELLRIEGHADESGSSRHNLELSRARAEAVRAALVARGMAAERLEAIGSGEARESRTERSVDFTILVWRDE